MATSLDSEAIFAFIKKDVTGYDLVLVLSMKYAGTVTTQFVTGPSIYFSASILTCSSTFADLDFSRPKAIAATTGSVISLLH